VPTATPPAPGYVAPSGGVTVLGASATNQFASSLLTASTDGTFIIQSTDTPAEPASGTSLSEYDVTANESAAGVVPGSLQRTGTTNSRGALAFASTDTSSLPLIRPRLDPRTAALARKMSKSRRSTTALSRRTEALKTSSFVVGSHRTFHVIQGTITGVGGTCVSPQIKVGSECYVDVPSTVKAVSSHAYVWVDDAITADPSYGFATSDFVSAASTFDTDYARETVAFGPAFFTPAQGYMQCDTTGTQLPQSSYAPTVDLTGTDPHISVLVTKALDGTGEGGYFDFGNDLNDQELNCATKAPHAPSNQLPMFVFGSDKYQTSSGTIADPAYWRNFDVPRGAPHEFQHYLHAMNKVLIPELKNNVQGYFDDSVIDEGDSMLAEDIVLGTGVNPPQSQDSRIASFFYLFAPGNFSVPSFTGYDQDPLSTSTTPPYGFFHNTLGSYGAAYLLERYMYDRFGGDAAMHRQYADLSPSSNTAANLHPLVAEAGNGETFAQLYDEFAAALAARGVASTDARFTFGSNVLLKGLSTFTFPGGATSNGVFNGPRSPEDLTSATPGTTARIKLTQGSTVHAKLITGATLFFNAAPSGGSIVSLSSSTAPGNTVDGGLVQGAYDDSTSCFGAPSSCHL
jgi:hypothetical protein